jgi:signal transduction histidine kinase
MEALRVVAPFFIFAGVIIILVLLYLRFVTNRAFKAILELIDLNEECGYDLHRFLAEAPQRLKRPDIEDMFYRVTYLDNTITREPSQPGKGMEKHFERSGYTVHIGIVPRVSRGERKHIYLITLEILFLLVEMDILIKIKAVNEAFANFSKLQTFVLHDVKNLTQFIQTMSFNLEHMKDTEKERKFLEYLRESIPALSLRAGKILNIVEMEREAEVMPSELQQIALDYLIGKLLETYNLEGEVRGSAGIYADPYKVTSIFDNIVRNIYEKARQEPNLRFGVKIEDAGSSAKVTVWDDGKPIPDLDRVFEPFYTTKKAGLGVGLFQAKSMVHLMGGDIRASNTSNGVVFDIVLPKGSL